MNFVKHDFGMKRNTEVILPHVCNVTPPDGGDCPVQEGATCSTGREFSPMDIHERDISTIKNEVKNPIANNMANQQAAAPRND